MFAPCLVLLNSCIKHFHFELLSNVMPIYLSVSNNYQLKKTINLNTSIYVCIIVKNNNAKHLNHEKKTIFISFLISLVFSTLYGKNNRLEVGMGNYKFFPDNYYQLLYAPILNNFNINYTRLINKNVSLYVNYLNAPITS